MRCCHRCNGIGAQICSLFPRLLSCRPVSQLRGESHWCVVRKPLQISCLAHTCGKMCGCSWVCVRSAITFFAKWPLKLLYHIEISAIYYYEMFSNYLIIRSLSRWPLLPLIRGFCFWLALMQLISSVTRVNCMCLCMPMFVRGMNVGKPSTVVHDILKWILKVVRIGIEWAYTWFEYCRQNSGILEKKSRRRGATAKATYYCAKYL